MNSKTLALLVLDVQDDIVGLYGRTPWMESVIGAIAGSIATARERDVPVAFVRVAFRPSYADVMPNRPSIKGRNRLNESQPGGDVIDDLRPQPLEAIVTKRRTGAFYMTDLELLLRRLGAVKLIVTRMSTARAVKSKVREAHPRFRMRRRVRWLPRRLAETPRECVGIDGRSVRRDCNSRASARDLF
jgi:nicotinamidase-related amidase